MSRVIWDNTTEKTWETGCDRCVLYKPNETGKYVGGEAWNGFRELNENPSGADVTKIYANNAVYGSMTAAEEYGGTISAYTYPDGWNECDGRKMIRPGVYIAQQTRKTFGLTYRTLIGNDTDGMDHGYTIHLIYGCQASPSSKDHSTVNENPEAVEMSWEFSCTPVPVKEAKPTCTMEFVSTEMTKEDLEKLENTLYGTDGAEGAAGTEPTLPLPDEILELLGATPAG